ncbi:MAG: Gfo/Idh/MocA family oxidoreductase [Patescibacteria group bacterium]|nr:Gfo/Idh/MocA family oxidoreductase [Patescibacteria group bacterium]
MDRSSTSVSRRRFLQGVAATSATLTIVPRHVLGGPENTPPSETLGGALIGCGGRGNGTFNTMGPNVKRLAECDVRFVGKADNKTIFTDFRRLLERKDIDVVAIATPPHWHALITIAAMQAGKDVMCEKPMTRFIGEGRVVVEAERRTGRIFQVCTFGRYGASQNAGNILTHKIMRSGLLNPCEAVHVKSGGLKVAQWSGMVNAQPQPVPDWLDWDMYCGPAPLRPYHPHRFGGSHRGYWDYEGGGLADMGQHHFDPVQWTFGKDDTSPVEIEAYAPPAHQEACGMWGWVELKYADGLTFVFDSREWGEPYDRKQSRGVSLSDLAEEDRKKVEETEDPEPLIGFEEAVKTRKKPGGHAEAAHRSSTLLHLANIAIRVGRKIHYDPVKEQIVGDETANRLVNPPMRAPWRL